MAGGVIVSVASNAYKTLYGDIQGPLAALIEQEYSKARLDQLTLWEEIFKPFGLKTSKATIASIGTVGLFKPVGENGEYPVSEIGKGFTKDVDSLEWKNSFFISQTMMEDKLDFVLMNNAKMLMDSAVRTKNAFYSGTFASAVLNRDYKVSTTDKVSIKTMDGVNLFSTAHKLANDKRTVSNAFSNTFSATNLGKVATEMQNMKDDNGEMMGLAPDTILIPNTEKAKSELFGVLGARNDPDTPGGNRYNYQFGNWKVIVLPWLVDTVNANTGDYPWILMDSHYNEGNYGALAVERIPLEVKSSIESNNDANRWAGRERYGAAFGDFRAFAAGGLEYGSEL